jgi:hypothetical protein
MSGMKITKFDFSHAFIPLFIKLRIDQIKFIGIHKEKRSRDPTPKFISAFWVKNLQSSVGQRSRSGLGVCPDQIMTFRLITCQTQLSQLPGHHMVRGHRFTLCHAVVINAVI